MLPRNPRIVPKRPSLQNKETGSLHNSTRAILLFIRILGLLPLFGLTTETSNKLRFTLWSPYTVYYVISFVGQVLMCISCWKYICQNGVSVDNVTCVMLYTSSLATVLFLAKTGHSWALLLRTVEKLENELPSFRKKYSVTITFATVLIVVSEIVEAIVFIIYKFILVYSCSSNEAIKNYFKVNIPWIFNYTPVTMWKGILSELLNIQAGFIIDCNDWLSVLVSLYLTEYFIVHNERLRKAIQQKHLFSTNYREEYLKIVQLVKLINAQFGGFLIISVGTSMHWICIELYYFLNGRRIVAPTHSNMCEFNDLEESSILLVVSHYAYSVFSFSSEVIRAFVVLQLAARIRSNALAPVSIFYDLPNSKFTVEVIRYISQIKDLKISLTGFDFFYVTRQMILSLLGTIATYEVMLFQFKR